MEFLMTSSRKAARPSARSESPPPARVEAMNWPADRVERRAVASLVPYARNARTHAPAQVDQIAASIREWGWTMPILVDEAGGVIAGHGRILAAKKLGLAEAPVVVARGWSEPQKRAYVLADNKLALNAGWDRAMLATELAELGEIDFDLRLVGFSAAEIKGALELPLTGEDGADQSDLLAACYEIIVTLAGEDEQRRLLDELHARGFACRALML
jgi:ParB-like chromosome segregation protein Spo0J